MTYALTFDGHDIGANYAVERHATRTLASWEPSLVDVPGRSGQLYAGTRALPAQLVFDIYATAETREGRQAEMRTLAGWLAVDEPKHLTLGDENGLYRLAIPTGEGIQEAYLNADHAEVTFICPDPRLYGLEQFYLFDTDTSGTVTVGGTAQTAPTIRANATGGADGFWRIVDETGAGIYAAIPSGTTYAVVADCAARTLTVNGEVVMLPPTYDWPEWEPGAHAWTVTGSNEGLQISWVEMWW